MSLSEMFFLSSSGAQVELLQCALDACMSPHSTHVVDIAADVMATFNARIIDGQQNQKRVFTVVVGKLLQPMMAAYTSYAQVSSHVLTSS